MLKIEFFYGAWRVFHISLRVINRLIKPIHYFHCFIVFLSFKRSNYKKTSISLKAKLILESTYIFSGSNFEMFILAVLKSCLFI